MVTDSENGLQSLSLHNLAYPVSDVENAIHWYGDILGFRVLRRKIYTALGDAEIVFLQKSNIHPELLKVLDGFRIEELLTDAPAHLLPIETSRWCCKSVIFMPSQLNWKRKP